MSTRSLLRAEGPGPSAPAGSAGLVLLLALLTGCAGASSGEEASPAAVSAASGEAPAPGASSAPAAEAERVGALVPEDPRTVVLPGGSSVPVRAVSTTANGLLDVPSNIGAAGWWRGGSRLGDPFGSTLLAAHVDSATQGLGPFAALLSVTDGERIVLRSASYDQTFRVRSLQLRPRGSIAPTSALHSPRGDRRLTLVTCAGPYDATRGGYQRLAVVVAVPVGPPHARAGT